MAEVKKKPKFLRKDWYKKPKLGKGRKKKQIWNRPRGRHNKIREKRKGHGKMPNIGFSQAKEIRGKIYGLIPVMVNNVSDLQKLNKEKEIAIFSSVGLKKKIDMSREAEKLGLKISFDVKKFLAEAENIVKERKSQREKKVKEVKEKAKKAKTEEKAKEDKKEEKEEEKKAEEKAGKRAEEKEKKMLMKPVEKEMPKEMAGKDVIIKRKALEK